MFAVLACPGSINSIGMFLLAGSVMQFGLIPAFLLGFSFVLVIISCYRILNVIFGDSFSTPTLFDLKYQKMILILIIFLPVVSLGIFPNIFLSWYMPSTSAIAELIQNALVK
jgi:NADH:ubiquinone oxidoreductase subunit 4 (subunit M)